VTIMTKTMNALIRRARSLSPQRLAQGWLTACALLATGAARAVGDLPGGPAVLQLALPSR